MNISFKIALVAILLSSPYAAHAYGSNSSSNHCEKPMFSEFQPSANKYLQSFNEFSFAASANTTLTSIEVLVSAGTLKYHFTHKDLNIETQNSGRLMVSGKLPRPIEHGFVRLSVVAHAKPGCEKNDGYLIRIQ